MTKAELRAEARRRLRTLSAEAKAAAEAEIGRRVWEVPEVAAAYRVSAHHVAKVAKALVRGGFIKSHRGRTGGLELAMSPAQVKVGAIVRETEPTLDLLECFDHRSSSCPGSTR